ncbi:MAG TPA: hypothetical protein VEW08_09115 [Steroidobacteraceae bacterium]|nr:hypothetical protein [Steroidobacteraceae bacterium]
MRNRVLAVFTTWPFLLALAVLLVNDWLLKQAYPGLVTGKLSDFAGIAVVSMPLFAAFPRHARAIYLAIFGAFLWWKSPASGAFIAFMNDVQPMKIGRTVDYWDLMALAIMPACGKFAVSQPCSFVNPASLRRWVLPPVLAATLFGVVATSYPRHSNDFNIRAVESSAPIPRDQIVAAISQVAKARGLKPQEPNPPHWAGAFMGRGIFLTYTFLGDNEIGVGINIKSGMFGDSEMRRAEKLRAEIKKTLSLRFKGLEFVEPPPKP